MVKHANLNKGMESESKPYNLRGFTPRIIDQEYLKKLKVEVKPTQETLQELQRGSSVFAKKYENRSLISETSWIERDISLMSH